jgi:hypothetical protein
VTYNEKEISSTTFQESNGAAELTITGSLPLLASFSNDGRTITIARHPERRLQLLLSRRRLLFLNHYCRAGRAALTPSAPLQRPLYRDD